MLTLSTWVKTISAVICFSMAAPVLAQSAPVYDVDSMQDGTAASSVSPQPQEDVYPPAPDQDGGSAFVPMQQQPAAASNPSATTASTTAGSVSSAQPKTSSSPEQRLQRLEQQISNMQSNDAGVRVESLQSQVQALRSQVEQLNHKMEQLQNQQKALFNHIIHDDTASAQLSLGTTPNASNDTVQPTDATATGSAKPIAGKDKTSTKPVAEVKAPAKLADAQPNVAEEQQIYQTAYNLIKEKKYEEAVNTLQGMLKKYPSGQFASNAHYWLGELYGLMSKNDQALTEFVMVVDTYPDSPRVPDAQLKVGLLYASQSKWPEAKTALKKVINRYPGSTPAKLAMEQLKQIKLSGH